jgi:hypothetical protein
MTHDHPEMVAEALDLLKAAGFIDIKPDPRNPDSVLVSASPRFAKMIAASGLTLRDFSRHEPS